MGAVGGGGGPSMGMPNMMPNMGMGFPPMAMNMMAMPGKFSVFPWSSSQTSEAWPGDMRAAGPMDTRPAASGTLVRRPTDHVTH